MTGRRFKLVPKKLKWWQKMLRTSADIQAVEVKPELSDGVPNPEWDKATHEQVIIMYPGPKIDMRNRHD